MFALWLNSKCTISLTFLSLAETRPRVYMSSRDDGNSQNQITYVFTQNISHCLSSRVQRITKIATK